MRRHAPNKSWVWPVCGSVVVHAGLFLAVLLPRANSTRALRSGVMRPREGSIEIEFRSRRSPTRERVAASEIDAFDPSKVTLDDPTVEKGEPTVVAVPEPSSGIAGGPTASIPEPSEPVGSPIFPEAKQTKRVVFLLDRSISMGTSGALDRARAEILSAVQGLPEDAEFEILVYNQRVTPLRWDTYRRLLKVSPETVALAKKTVSSVTATGSTHVEAAIREGLMYRPECLYVVADSVKLDSRAMDGITRRNQRRTAIHLIALSDFSNSGDAGLRVFAKNNRGSFRRERVAEPITTSLGPLPR